MAEAELSVEELSSSEMVIATAGIASALEKNEHFPDPHPTPPELDALAAELSKVEDIYLGHRRQASEARMVRDEVAGRLRLALTRVVAYVQETSGGDAAKILSANLHIEEPTRIWPFSSAGYVDEIMVSLGDQPGEIDLAWDAVPGAVGYEVEIATDLAGDRWEQGGATATSRITLEELEPGSRYWFRVRAVSKRGVGNWSEPVVKYAR